MTNARPSSLNFKEINVLLAALDLTGSRLQEFFQPRPETLILGCFGRGRLQRLAFILDQRACRFHLLSGPVPKEKTRQRFVAFLHSRLKDAVIENIEHVHDQRVLKISCVRGGERSCLWIRLWASAPNVIFTDESGLIGDALYRRPGKGEISGGHYEPTAELAAAAARNDRTDRFTVRDFGGDESLSLHERVEAYFNAGGTQTPVERLRERLLNGLGVEERRFTKALAAAEAWLTAHGDVERYRQYGDILMGDLAAVAPDTGWYRGNDFFSGNAPIEIALEKNLSPAQNAEKYYRLYKKTKGTQDRMEREREAARRGLAAVAGKMRAVEAEEDPARLEALVRQESADQRNESAGGRPGLTYSSGGFTILVGRTARDNEELFRRHVRGNDLWLHVRDFPGASVFIRSRKQKSVPLDVLLDAANLALLYSKARNQGKADLYYTRVKYLKKAKGGPTGLFLPTQEKNIAVRFDPERIGRLKAAAQNDI